ncbi:MAG TPA: cytochrome bc complex cytochrome b subunit [Thermoanaerobaculia bacterium]|nr:cytochrome bc complex cytochrome b subunit [Thermoanaerobaculia bacterium]HUM28571.1 cytochrome bc complex cytochrome b subunit [Thermoanaerobaculia bacterium]HXK66821.1 cytochrome bc complex cytochrome b subunit [Thermoanaerobaculia bacterium]
MIQRLLTWLEDRVDLSSIKHLIQEKTVPRHRMTGFYFFGGVALFFFIVQIISGILLLFYYRPTSEEAFESVKFIMTQVPFGWLVRSIHSWSANLMILSLFLHMFSTFFMRAYRKPREITWITGFLLLGLSMGFGFTGYLLPWNKLAFFATRVGTDMVSVVPLIGEWLLRVLRGGEDVTGATLTRFFGIHVTILPMIVFALLGIHLVLIQQQGMSVPIGARIKGQIPFFPNFMMKDLLAWLLALAVLAGIASIFPWELGVKADPFASAPAGIKPEWYFLFMFQALKVIPAHVLGMEGEVLGLAAFGLCGLLFMLVPFLDRKAQREERSKLITGAGWVAVIFIVAMTIWAYLD